MGLKPWRVWQRAEVEHDINKGFLSAYKGPEKFWKTLEKPWKSLEEP